MEAGYIANPYHNNIHAADVTQTMSFFITKPFLLPYVKPLEILGSLLAAAIHDYRHPGVNNAFHVATDHELAIRYNDQSVLEAMHVASFFELLQDEEMNPLADFSRTEYMEMRSLMIDMVLGTDMAHHFTETAKFKTKLLQVARSQEQVRRGLLGLCAGLLRAVVACVVEASAWRAQCAARFADGATMARLQGTGAHIATTEDTHMYLKMALHSSDVSNPVKPLAYAKRWADLIVAEFYAQGDAERERGIPISSFMDRTKGNIPKLQLGFINFIVAPLFEEWASVVEEIEAECMPFLRINVVYWERRMKREEKEQRRGSVASAGSAVSAVRVRKHSTASTTGAGVGAGAGGTVRVNVKQKGLGAGATVVEVDRKEQPR